MKFGFSTAPELVDFQMPGYQVSELEYLSGISSDRTAPVKFYFGETSWNNPEWKGSIFPARLPVKDFISHYGLQFNSIELNTTHYRIPDGPLINKWKDSMPEAFAFSPKFPQSISHRKDFGLATGQMDLFLACLQEFRPKLGLPFFQFPTYFKVSDFEKIELILNRMDPDIPIAIELRDTSFYEEETLSRLIHLLRRYQATLVHTDTTGVRDIVHNRISSNKLFLRFVGCGIPEVDFARIDDWVSRIVLLVSNGLREIYFYLHEPDHYQKADMALYLWGKIRDNPMWTTRGPTLHPTSIQTKLF